MPPGSEHCIPDGRNVWTAEEIMLKNKPTLVKFKFFCVSQAMNFSAYPRVLV